MGELRTNTRRTRAARTGVIAAALLMLVAGQAAAAVPTAPTPDSGPIAGGTEVIVPAPERVTFTELQSGGLHTLAQGTDGKTYAWGHNGYGQLGNGKTGSLLAPFPVSLPAGVTFTGISAGVSHSIAVGSDGHAYVWGENDKGQQGTASGKNVLIPTLVPGLEDLTIVQVVAAERASYALTADGELYTWGHNTSGKLGHGAVSASNVAPAKAAQPAGVSYTSFSALGHFTLATGSDGHVYAWGAGTSGELGNGASKSSQTPVQVIEPAGVTWTEVQAGGDHSVGLGSDGKTYIWGSGMYGQQGNGTTANNPTPVELVAPGGIEFASFAMAPVAPASETDRLGAPGGYHTVAIATNGKVYAWGQGRDGQLGNGSTADQGLPTEVAVPAGVTFTQVETGLFSSMALDASGQAYGWGYNVYGQIGNGKYDESELTPQRTLMDPVVTQITFDGLPGLNPTPQADGSWKVTTPAHAAGPVDVTVAWRQLALVREPVTHVAGFTYLAQAPAAPTVDCPMPTSVTGIVTLTGEVSAEAASVRVSATTGTGDPVLLGEATISGSDDPRPWTYTNTTPLEPGTHSLTVTAANAQGTASAPATPACEVTVLAAVPIVGSKHIEPVEFGSPVLPAGAPSNWDLTVTAEAKTQVISGGAQVALIPGVAYTVAERLRQDPAPDADANRYTDRSGIACVDGNGTALPESVFDSATATITLDASGAVSVPGPISCDATGQAAQATLVTQLGSAGSTTPATDWSLELNRTNDAVPVDGTEQGLESYALTTDAAATVAMPGPYQLRAAAPKGQSVTRIERLQLEKADCAAKAPSPLEAPATCWETLATGADADNVMLHQGTHSVFRIVAEKQPGTTPPTVPPTTVPPTTTTPPTTTPPSTDASDLAVTGAAGTWLMLGGIGSALLLGGATIWFGARRTRSA